MADLSSWGSYSSIFNMGHRVIKDLLTVTVNVEEKVDGSQFSFMLDDEGELHIRSKGATMYIDAPEKMFNKAVESVKARKDLLHVGWTYRGEFLAKPKHNALTYSRVPVDNIILFDINVGEQAFLTYQERLREGQRLGLEVVPVFYSGTVESLEFFRSLLDTESVLGGQKIEGVVVKPSDYNLFGPDKKVLMGKFVSEHFKEVHKQTWGESNPAGKDIIQKLGEMYRSPARWQKAVIHLAEKGLIQDSPKDIGLLIKEIPGDILSDSKEDIKDALFKWAWPQISRICVSGFPDYYKEQLLKKQFENIDQPGIIL